MHDVKEVRELVHAQPESTRTWRGGGIGASGSTDPCEAELGERERAQRARAARDAHEGVLARVAQCLRARLRCSTGSTLKRSFCRTKRDSAPGAQEERHARGIDAKHAVAHVAQRAAALAHAARAARGVAARRRARRAAAASRALVGARVRDERAERRAVVKKAMSATAPSPPPCSVKLPTRTRS